ncbi:MAG: CRTAC1 family protein [Thermoguttaceae bacterium]|nr:CRTAC1 family protein [Thermoguttaceae bacterium]
MSAIHQVLRPRAGAVLWIFTLAVATACSGAFAQIVLRDVTSATGITFEHTDGSSGRRYIVETVCSGLATFDYDGDGLIDIYFVSGRPLPGANPDRPARNALYRNLGGFRFVDVTEQAGVGGRGYGMGVCVGDYDSDGLPDLYVSNFGPNVLYRNNGDGTFTEVTARAGVARGDKLGAGVNFLDIDGDGDLDLFVSNYVRFRYDLHVVPMLRGIPRYAGPRFYPHQPNQLFRNEGDGTFREITAESGIGNHPGPGMGTVCADYDDDGDPDIFVANDTTTGNFLFRNDGHGKFTERGLLAGVGLSLYGEAVSAMAVDCADYDNDGRLDFFVTDYQGELPMLFRNRGDGMFDDVTMLAGAGAGGLNNVKWGCGFVDFDNDGLRDIFYVRGHIDDNVEQVDRTTSYLDTPVLLRNLGNGKFANVSASSGDGLRVRAVGRGAAFDDLDNDGRVDVVILSSRRRAIVLRNESPGQNHWIQLRLVGTRTNRDGVGARVQVTAGDLVLVDEVHSGRGYQGHFGSRLHFGLGQRQHVPRVEVRWPGGPREVFQSVSSDQLGTLIEGSDDSTNLKKK